MLIVGITGTELAPDERTWLQHPAVSGVILFARNFATREQTMRLIDTIRATAPRPLLLCVDQEGGRVQRFRAGFARLPPIAAIGPGAAEGDLQSALIKAEHHAWLMAAEMRAIGIDLSFAPVVDLKRGNRAIGDRAFAAQPTAVSRFAEAYLRGMHAAGMAATLKHFPGHGSVLEDTHFVGAIDPRSRAELEANDLLPFRQGIAVGAEAVMMAHVSYPAVDAAPAGYSARWVGEILRGELGFRGVVISDDIGMAAAQSVGGVAARLAAHIDAGCDLVLVCAPALVPEALAALPCAAYADRDVVACLRGRDALSWSALKADARYPLAYRALSIADESPMQEPV